MYSGKSLQRQKKVKVVAYDHAKLKTVIDSEPANNVRTDEEVLAWLKTERTTHVPVQTEDFVRYLAVEGIWAAMHDSADAGVITARDEIDMITQRLPTVDTQSTRAVAVMDSLIAAGVANSTQKAEAMALSDAQQTPLQESGLGRAVLGDVIIARSL